MPKINIEINKQYLYFMGVCLSRAVLDPNCHDKCRMSVYKSMVCNLVFCNQWFTYTYRDISHWSSVRMTNNCTHRLCTTDMLST